MKGRYIFFAIMTLMIPFVMMMSGVVLVFTNEFLQFEYRDQNFPPDPYGFTLEQRIEYGTASVNYITDMLNKFPDEYLAGLQKDDGTPLYNERELSHMKDVKTVFQTARGVMAGMIVFIILTGWLVSKKPDALPGFLRALSMGSCLTLILMAVIGFGIVTGFDAFFEQFHHLFFTGDSWLFYADDSLIRLFPEKLWSDGFTLAAILTGILAVLILIVSLMASRKLRALRERRAAR